MEGLIITAIVLLCVSLVFSMFGKGGGEFYLPVIITILNIPFYTAAGVSLFLIFLQSISMVFVYSARNKLLDWKLAITLAIVVASMAFLGGFVSYGIPVAYLKTLFAIFLLVSAYFMLRRKNVNVSRGKFGVWHREFSGGSYDMNLLYIILPVALVAFVAGMVGISGGGLIIPVCFLLGAVPLNIAMGTNTFLVLTSSSMSFLGHALKGGFDFKLCLILGAMVILGSQIGSRLHTRVNESFLRIGFVIILVAAAVWMIIKIFF